MRIVIVGGGSRQWGPTLVGDLAGTPSLAGATVVLHDIDESSLAPMLAFCERIEAVHGNGLTYEAITDRGEALDGADFVVVTISTGGFDSMAHDLDVPLRYGIRQSVGDTVGPGGINRALRNIPVLVDIAHDMEARCPDAWLLNITNPMTCLTRAVAHETDLKVVGLCHEIGHFRWQVAKACGVRTREVEVEITGVNHLPWITSMTVAGSDGFEAVRAAGPPFADEHQLKLALLDRYGALPGAGDRHVAEFFPWALTEESGWGKEWGIHLTTIQDRHGWEEWFRAVLAGYLDGSSEPETKPSGEMVAPVIDSLLTGTRRELPLNLPNRGQAPYLPDDVVVETICVVDGDGIRGRDTTMPPAPCAAWIRRHVEVQELTVSAALSGDRSLVRAALDLDPLAGRIDARSIDSMCADLLTATAAWLPQFA